MIGGNRRQGWKRFALVLVLASLSAGGYLWISHRTYGLGFPLDDAWIHQTYARNLAQRGEWSFIPGQPSAGSTAPLWSAALAFGYWLDIDPQVWSYLLGILLLAATAWASGRWLAVRHPAARRWALLVAIGVALEWHLVWAAVSGMETLALALVAVLCLWWLDAVEGRLVLLGVLIGVGVWLRPDALSLLLPTGYVLLHQSGWRPWPAAKGLVRVGVGLGLLMAPYLALNRVLSGAWWPSTFYAKQAEYAVLTQAPLVSRLTDMLALPFVGASALLLPGILIAAIQPIWRRDWRRLTPLLWGLAFIGLYALRLPATYQHGRYAMPTVPVFLVLGFEGMSGWVRPKAGRMSRWTASWAWLLSLPIAWMVFWFLGARAYGRDVAIIESEMVATARWIEDNTPSDAVVAAHDIGAIGYFARRELIDMAGLVSPEVIPFIRDESALHEDLATLAQVLVAGFRLAAPHGYAEPHSLANLLAVAVSVGPIGGHRQVGDRLAAGSVAHLRIAAQIADQNHFVEHGDLLSDGGQDSVPARAAGARYRAPTVV
jgi:hypothetical protein